MSDQMIPSLSIINEGIPIKMVLLPTQTQVEEQGYTYNQAGYTYNQAGVAYGGIFNKLNQDIVPFLTTAQLLQPSLIVVTEGVLIDIKIPQTYATDQGYTYNQVNFIYNQSGISYDGLSYINQDIVPIDLSFVDMYAHGEAPFGVSIGPGWFMFITGI